MTRKRIILSFIAFCLHVAFFEATGQRMVAGTVLSEGSYPISREVQYAFDLRNKTNRLLKKAEFWTYAPVNQTSTQRCAKLEVSCPYEIITDDLGNQVLYFRFEDLPPYATKLIAIKARVEVSDRANPISLSDVQSFLRPEKYIESDHPEIAGFARRFESDIPRRTAENVFRWVADHIRHTGYLKKCQGALYALRKRQGDCTESMCLFTALCRANKIPARGIGGYVTSESGILNPSSYHNWAEFYEDGAWRIGDPQKNVFMEKASQYIAMRIIGDPTGNPMGEHERFRFTGDGLEVIMKAWTELKGT